MAQRERKFGIVYLNDGYACINTQSGAVACAREMEKHKATGTLEENVTALSNLRMGELFRQHQPGSKGARLTTWFVIRLW